MRTGTPSRAATISDTNGIREDPPIEQHGVELGCAERPTTQDLVDPLERLVDQRTDHRLELGASDPGRRREVREHHGDVGGRSDDRATLASTQSRRILASAASPSGVDLAACRRSGGSWRVHVVEHRFVEVDPAEAGDAEGLDLVPEPFPSRTITATSNVPPPRS